VRWNGCGGVDAVGSRSRATAATYHKPKVSSGGVALPRDRRFQSQSHGMPAPPQPPPPQRSRGSATPPHRTAPAFSHRTATPQRCLPAQHVQFTLIRPLFRNFNQSLSDRVESNVVPFLAIAFGRPQTMVPTSCLPTSGLFLQGFCCQRFPISNPTLKKDNLIAWRGKKMKVVRHDNVFAYEPRSRIPPNRLQCLVAQIIGKPGHSVTSTYSCYNQSRPFGIDQNTFCRVSALGKFSFHICHPP